MRDILFTDLDGTLLDHHTYLPGPALPALRRLQQAGVLILPATAKTLAEVRVLSGELDLDGGAVVENGAAFVLDGAVTVLGTRYEVVRRLLAEAAAEAGARVRGYGDMTADEVAAETGLSPAEAVRARARQWSETFLVADGSAASLIEALDRRGLRVARGARFLTAMGAHDKGSAARLLLDRLDGPLRTWAVGDATNDAELLAAVDNPMLVRAEHGGWADVDLPGLVRLDGIGPAGWVLAAERIIRERHHDGATPE